jgi:penicillin-binding protein 1A
MSARLRRQRRRRNQRSASRAAVIVLGTLFTVIVLGGLSAVGYVVAVANSGPDLASLKPQDPGRNSVVYASDGRRLGVIQNDIIRFTVPSNSMPENVRQATVAVEDRRFYQHQGVDIEGVIRAAVKNLTSGETVQGGSTLTMQLIRNLYITKERTFKRKIREAKLAEELENVHPGRKGKEWILTKYLNSVPYGTNGGQTAVGIQAASRVYFDKPASRLNLEEAALLSGLPQAPSLYNPFREPERALARRNEVLGKMADQGYIKQATALAAMARPLGVKRTRFFREKRESYFFDYVTDELNRRYGVQRVRTGGLRIKTTIDLDLQKRAREAIARDLSFAGAPSSAIVTIDPRNGYIRAMATSAKYKDSKFNLAAQGKRQPGSTFKIMALVAAVRAGIDPKSKTYTSKPLNYRGTPIKTYGNKYAGTINLTRATLKSDNSVYFQLALDIGPGKVAKAAHDLGIRSHLEGVPSETLGGLKNCCSPLEMANAYATIASGGWRNRPKAVTRVAFPEGKVDDLSEPRRHKAFDSAAMYEVTKILDQNVPDGTGRLAQINGCPAAGKTGTTDKNTDAWFVGFTPKLATSVWVGFPKGRVPMGNLFQGGPVDGGTFPADIWGKYMQSISKNCGQFAKPDHAFRSKAFKSTTSQQQVQPSTGAAPYDPGAGAATPAPVEPPPPPPPPSSGTGGEGFDPNDYQTPVDPPPPPLPPPPPPD